MEGLQERVVRRRTLGGLSTATPTALCSSMRAATRRWRRDALGDGRAHAGARRTRGRVVVATVMSNSVWNSLLSARHQALARERRRQVRARRTPAYGRDARRRQSGHLIFPRTSLAATASSDHQHAAARSVRRDARSTNDRGLTRYPRFSSTCACARRFLRGVAGIARARAGRSGTRRGRASAAALFGHESLARVMMKAAVRTKSSGSRTVSPPRFERRSEPPESTRQGIFYIMEKVRNTSSS